MTVRAIGRPALVTRSWTLAVVAVLTASGVVASAATADAAVTTMAPARILDTRLGLGGPKAKVGLSALRLSLPQAAGASSVMLNVTATDADGPGFVRVWPCAADEPPTSSLNYEPGRTVANAVVVRADSGGVCVSSRVPANLVIDLSGWFSGTGDIAGSTPNRIVDTRTTGDPLAAGVERRIHVAGTTGIPANATLAVLNLTITNPAGPGWLVAYPCGSPTSSSTMNFTGGTVANLTFAGLANGDVCVRSLVATDLVVDTSGSSGGSGAVRVQSPSRLLDTRDPQLWPYGAARSDATISLQAAGRGGVPADAAAALVTVTAADAGADGYVSVWPCDQSWASTSTLNTWPGQGARANLAMVRLAADGTMCLKAFTGDGSPMNLVVDAVGWITGGPPRNVPPPTTPPPPSGGHFGMLPVGAALPTDAQCAAAVRPATEVRPRNATYNQTRGSAVAGATGLYTRVTGNFAGTTDEIIQWAACKWGIDEDYVRAQVVIESWWHQWAAGDFSTDASGCAPGHPIGADGTPGQCPQSIGLMQVRYPVMPTAFPWAGTSSAFNVDYALAARRSCFEGVETWLNTVERGRTYAAGDIWGCIGTWFSGRWYTASSQDYIARVQDALARRVWTTADFLGGA